VPIKPFHLGPDSEDAQLVLFMAYMRVSALAAALRGIVEEEGRDVPWAADILNEVDQRVVQVVRGQGPN